MAIYTLAADERVKFAKILAPRQHLRRDDRRAARRAGRRPRRGHALLPPGVPGRRARVRRAGARRDAEPARGRGQDREVGGRGAGGVVAHRGARRRHRDLAGRVPAGRDRRGRARARSCSTPPARSTATRCPPGPASRSSRTPAASAWSCRTCSPTRASPCPPCRRRCRTRSARCCPPFASPANPVDVTPVWSRFAELYPALTDLLGPFRRGRRRRPGAAATRGAGREDRRGAARRGGGPARRRRARAGARVLGGAP